MSSAPPASILTTLSLLPSHVPSQHSQAERPKIRLASCVQRYDVTRAHLYLSHRSRHNTTSTRTDRARDRAQPKNLAANVVARVDTNLVLGTIGREVLKKGAWVNVIGYIQGSEPLGEELDGLRKDWSLWPEGELRKKGIEHEPSGELNEKEKDNGHPVMHDLGEDGDEDMQDDKMRDLDTGGIRGKGGARVLTVVDIQALLLWDAGPLKIEDFENAVLDRLKID